MRIGAVGWRYGEALLPVRQKLLIRQAFAASAVHAPARRNCLTADLCCVEEPLDSSLGLRTVGRNALNSQLVEGASFGKETIETATAYRLYVGTRASANFCPHCA